MTLYVRLRKWEESNLFLTPEKGKTYREGSHSDSIERWKDELFSFYTLAMDSTQKFIDAQSGNYATALRELRDGRKRSHWIWYFFPQVIGLGHSPVSRAYALKSAVEVREYLANDTLSRRLAAMTRAVIESPRSIDEIFGYPDNLKFISSMTLFARFSEEDSLFREALQIKNGGREDGLTLEIVEKRNW